MAKKRLIICCDGTSNDAVGHDSPMTNVARISRCVKAEDDNGVVQIVYYLPGVGTGTSRTRNLYDSIIGRGITHDICEAYSFICDNYSGESDDSIVLIGFSRGAFTVRAIASFINDVGVLTKKGLRSLWKLYALWEKQLVSKKSTKPSKEEDLEEECTRLSKGGQLRRGVTIEACAIWDTVCALGPRMFAGIPQPASKKLAFVNSTLCPNIKLAIQALALNERRRHFQPVLWEEPLETQRLRQCWFLGTHSDVGGGNADMGLANIALAWTISQLRGVVAFDTEAICDITSNAMDLQEGATVKMVPGEEDRSFEFSVDMPLKEMQKRVATIQTSLSSQIQAMVGGSELRKPGQYKDPRDRTRVLGKTNETIHSSVNVLLEKSIIDDREATKGFTRTEAGVYQQTSSSPNSATTGQTVLPEEEQQVFEKEILATWTMRRLLLSCRGAFAHKLGHPVSNPIEPDMRVVPIYAILHDPAQWAVASGKGRRSRIGLEVNGTLSIEIEGDAMERKGVKQMFEESRKKLFAGPFKSSWVFGEAIEREGMFLTGRIGMPFPAGENPYEVRFGGLRANGERDLGAEERNKGGQEESEGE